jgi:hypothetical protein
MTITYVTAGAWGGGVGRVLVAGEVDTNFWTHDQAITALQALPLGVSISSIVQTAPNQITITLTDGRTYIFTLPALTYNWRGVWAPNTYYAVNDTFSVASYNTTYVVTFAHISAATFNPGASDGSGHAYYAVLFAQPNPLPVGGTTGAVLAKNSGTDFDVVWNPGLPVAGAAGTALFKNSITNYDTLWRQPGFSDLAGAPTPAQLRAPVNSILTPTSGVAPLDPTLGNIFTLTPTADTAIGAVSAPVDARVTVFVTGSATSYNVTFGAFFVSTGVLATGTASGRFVVSFVGNGSSLFEISRSGPL